MDSVHAMRAHPLAGTSIEHLFGAANAKGKSAVPGLKPAVKPKAGRGAVVGPRRTVEAAHADRKMLQVSMQVHAASVDAGTCCKCGCGYMLQVSMQVHAASVDAGTGDVFGLGSQASPSFNWG